MHVWSSSINRQKIFERYYRANSLVVTLSRRYVLAKICEKQGMNIGIDQFGESAPYKEVYGHFDLSEEKIVDYIQKKLKNKLN